MLKTDKRAILLVFLFILSVYSSYCNSNPVDKVSAVNVSENDIVSIHDWKDTRLKFRKNITVHSSQVFGNLTNFPLLVQLFDPDLKNVLDKSGKDILFTDINDALLHHEIEEFIHDYNNTHAYLVAWVKTNLTSSIDTTIFMYYGGSLSEINSKTTNVEAENHVNVWDKDYVSVWHLKETSGTRYDSTRNKIDGSPQNYDNDENVTGVISGADSFDGVDDYIETYKYPDELGIGQKGEKTISSWVYTRKFADSGIFEFGQKVTRGYCSLKTDSKNDSWTVDLGNMSINFIYPSLNEWVYFVIKFDDKFLQILVDGKLLFNISMNLNIGNKITFKIGLGENNGFFDGIIDEMRISTIARSNAWILTEYQNQRYPNSFYTVNIQEIDDTPPEVIDFDVSIHPNNSSLIFYANVTDVDSYVKSVNLSINDEILSMRLDRTDKWIYVYSPVHYGDNFRFQIINASDSFGNYLSTETVIKEFTFTYDSSPPQVKAAYFKTDNVFKPTTITFFAEIIENDSGVEEILLHYYLEEVDTTNQGFGSRLRQIPSEPWLTTNMTFLKSTGGLSVYSVTVPFSQNSSNWKVIFQISTADQYGNVNENAFSIDSNQANENIISYSSSPPQPIDFPILLIESPYIVLNIIIFIIVAMIILFLYTKYQKKPGIVLPDRNLLVKSLKNVNESDLRLSIPLHTFGVVVSHFNEQLGPVPMVYHPKSLGEDSKSLYSVVFRTFSNCEFTTSEKKINHAFFNFSTEQRFMKVLSYTIALKAPHARSGFEHFSVAILMNPSYDYIMNQFNDLLLDKIGNIHKNVVKNKNDYSKLNRDAKEIREYVSRIILKYKELFGEF